jgi:hypothetical protein
MAMAKMMRKAKRLNHRWAVSDNGGEFGLRHQHVAGESLTLVAANAAAGFGLNHAQLQHHAGFYRLAEFGLSRAASPMLKMECTAAVCAIASTISTPGMIGRPGK